MQTKVLQAFAEMGLSPSRLVMPTKENVAQLEGLLEAVTAMLETKKLLDKVDHDIQVTQKQTSMRNGQLEDGEGDAEPDVKTEEPMDVDQAQEETDGNEGRGHSVMSVRSIRSRKKVRYLSIIGSCDVVKAEYTCQSHRSMSISSVDTNATSLSTRNTKRQKRG
jgi:DNA methyltransferase 1-associated protein 1